MTVLPVRLDRCAVELVEWEQSDVTVPPVSFGYASIVRPEFQYVEVLCNYRWTSYDLILTDSSRTVIDEVDEPTYVWWDSIGTFLMEF